MQTELIERTYGTLEVARMTGLRRHQVVYMVLDGHVPEPAMRDNRGDRRWTAAEIDALVEARRIMVSRAHPNSVKAYGWEKAKAAVA